MRSSYVFAGLGFACIFFISTASANNTFEVEYDSSSPIKSISLKNATLMLELYDHEKPSGYLEVKTDANGAFTLKDSQDFEIVSLQGERQYKAHCSGYATTDTKKVQISCQAN